MTTKEHVLRLIEELIFKEHAEAPRTNNKQATENTLETLCYLRERIETECHEPKIKQLVWEDCFAIAYIIDGWDYSYVIEQLETFNLYFDNIIIENLPTEAEAKAYAQEHFENLIRGCYE
jgi:TPP-dependent indolepyruvate ferredoxin oxidoreductase alpha subunit